MVNTSDIKYVYGLFLSGHLYKLSPYKKRLQGTINTITKSVRYNPVKQKYDVADISELSVKKFKDCEDDIKILSSYSKGVKKMILEDNIGKEAWITYIGNKPWDGPHRRCSTNKANLTKYVNNQNTIPDLDNMIIKKHLVKSDGTLKRIRGEDYKLGIKDKKKYILIKLSDMS